MTDRFKLDMYLSPQTAVLFADLQRIVCADIDFAAYMPNDGCDSVCLGQICGIDFANSAAGDYRYLATLALEEEAVPAGYYRSVLVSPARGGLTALEEFDPDKHLVAVNEPGSFSGSLTFARALLGSSQSRFPQTVLTGSHAASLGLVARSKVMLASIDCVSFDMVTGQDVRLKEQVRVLGYTDPFPGLPFVTSGGMPDDICALMTDRLLGFVDGKRKRVWADRLGVKGIVKLPEASYQKMRLV